MKYSILKFGATGNGKEKDTKAIQKAIDECSSNGGGEVYIPNGKYLVGTIYFKSNVTMYLDYNAEILGSTDILDYANDTGMQLYTGETELDKCLIYANECENITLKGHGTINGQGEKFGQDKGIARPMMFRYHNCKNIKIKDIRMKNPASWTNSLIACTNIWINGTDISSRANMNGDGYDFDGCENVFISDCNFNCSDDCICLQNSFKDKECKNVVVTNCNFKTRWAGMRIGLLSCSPIRNLTVSNCIFREIDCSGLKIQSSEGSILENMTFTNLIMENVVRPMFITANRFRERTGFDDSIKTKSILRNMKFSNIISVSKSEDFLNDKETEPECITIDCADDDIIENISLSNIHLELLGGKPNYKSTEILNHENKRAEGYNYKGKLPAYGLFARNVKNLTVKDFTVDLKKKDSREKCCYINTENN